MQGILYRAALALVAGGMLAGAAAARAEDAEAEIARHMVGQALLAAHLVAIAERAGMSAEAINALLKDVADRSAIEEFWISDAQGHAYLTNTTVDFTFSPDPPEQPQASAFWPLLEGTKEVVIQEARHREIDDRVCRYVGVAGVDRPRIVQVGVCADPLLGASE